MKGKYLLLGTNLGDKKVNLQKAIHLIKELVGPVISESSIYETEAWGFKDQPTFYNQVVQIDTDLNPYDLLTAILKIELNIGRVRYEKWHERLIDIDILYLENEIIEEENLKVPHPEIPNRRFTLAPLNEIAYDQIHPGTGYTIKDLLSKTSDILKVWKV